MNVKKIVVFLAVIFMVFTPMLAKGGSDNIAEKNNKTDFIIGVVTDTGGIDDKSFNQGTWEGATKFADSINAEAKYLQSETDADYIPNLSTFADEQLDIIVAPGFLFQEAITEVATNFPNQKFLIIDSVVSGLPNVTSAIFMQNEASFLVGVAGALQVKKEGGNSIGIILGMDFPLMQEFEAGFEAGVKAVDKNMKIHLEIANSFGDSQKGQTLASKLFDNGIKVIYQVAGGTGNGVIKEARDRKSNGENVWVIGVDKDQYKDGIYNGKDSVILTSMLKRVDTAAHDVSKMVYDEKFPGGQVVKFSLLNNGVGIPKDNPNLSEDILKEIEKYSQQIKNGTIDVPLIPSRLR